MPLLFWLLCLLCCWIPLSQAEIVLDGTLGPSGALTAPDYQIPATLGQQRGDNLFHSFTTFNLLPTETATFSGPANIQRIISRVTGGHPSQIAGALNATIPEADVYLLNPAGIVFSDNARLNISGSFYASTAETLDFTDGSVFNARFPELSTLTTAPVAAFGFVNQTAAGIRLNNADLAIPAGKALTLQAGDVSLNNSRLTSVGSDATVPTIHIQAEQLQLERSIITSLASETQPGGAIHIQAQQIVLQNDAAIVSLTDFAQQAGDINLEAESITLTDFGEAHETFIANATSAAGNSGNVLINANQLTLRNGTEMGINLLPSSSGNSGRMEVKVTDNILLTGLDNQGESSELVAATNGQGDISPLHIEANNIILENGAILGAAIFGTGNVGDANIQATGHLSLSGAEDDEGSQLGIIIGQTGTGQGGNINIQAGDITVKDGGLLGGITGGLGSTGDVNIAVADTIRIIGGNESTLSQLTLLTVGGGQAGTLHLKTRNLYLSDGGLVVSAAIFGSGDTGNIIIQAAEGIYLDSPRSAQLSGIVVGSSGEGNAGTIVIEAAELQLADGAVINATATGNGNAGDIQLTIDGDIHLSGVDSEGEGSAIAVEAEGSGNAGTLAIRARNLFLTDGATMGAASEGSGNAGNVDIIIEETIALQGFDALGTSSLIGVSAVSEGNAGTITLRAKQLRLADGAIILGEALGDGEAGNIDIVVEQADFSGQNLQALQDDFAGDFQTELTASSGIYAGTEGRGQGGTINLMANTVRLADTATINTSTKGSGNGGKIFINAGKMRLDQANIIAESLDAGNAGSVQMRIQDTLVMNDSLINTGALREDGGNIEILSGGYLRLRDSQIRTDINAPDGSDGNIVLNNQFVILDQSQIIAETLSGEAGAIDIVTQSLFIFPPAATSEIRATSDLTLDIALEQENTADFTVLPTEFLAADSLLLNPCSAIDQSSFTLAEYPGIGFQPDDLHSAGLVFLPFPDYAKQHFAPLRTTTTRQSLTQTLAAKCLDMDT